PPSAWKERYAMEYSKPIEQRTAVVVIWKLGHVPIGFSSADKIKYGSHANLHLHILKPENRKSGFGTICVTKSASFFLSNLRLERLFCEPNAFNIGPNRTLQRAGFEYPKTHRTVPGPLNFHQAVTRWVLERDKFESR